MEKHRVKAMLPHYSQEMIAVKEKKRSGAENAKICAMRMYIGLRTPRFPVIMGSLDRVPHS